MIAVIVLVITIVMTRATTADYIVFWGEVKGFVHVCV